MANPPQSTSPPVCDCGIGDGRPHSHAPDCPVTRRQVYEDAASLERDEAASLERGEASHPPNTQGQLDDLGRLVGSLRAQVHHLTEALDRLLLLRIGGRDTVVVRHIEQARAHADNPNLAATIDGVRGDPEVPPSPEA